MESEQTGIAFPLLSAIDPTVGGSLLAALLSQIKSRSIGTRSSDAASHPLLPLRTSSLLAREIHCVQCLRCSARPSRNVMHKAVLTPFAVHVRLKYYVKPSNVVRVDYFEGRCSQAKKYPFIFLFQHRLAG